MTYSFVVKPLIHCGDNYGKETIYKIKLAFIGFLFFFFFFRGGGVNSMSWHGDVPYHIKVAVSRFELNMFKMSFSILIVNNALLRYFEKYWNVNVLCWDICDVPHSQFFVMLTWLPRFPSLLVYCKETIIYPFFFICMLLMKTYINRIKCLSSIIFF